MRMAFPALAVSPVRQLLERPEPPVGLDEPDEVPAGPDGDVPQRHLGRDPVPGAGPAR